MNGFLDFMIKSILFICFLSFSNMIEWTKISIKYNEILNSIDEFENSKYFF